MAERNLPVRGSRRARVQASPSRHVRHVFTVYLGQGELTQGQGALLVWGQGLQCSGLALMETGGTFLRPDKRRPSVKGGHSLPTGVGLP